MLVDFEVDYRYADGVELNYKVGGNQVYVRFEGDNGWVKAWYMGKPDKNTPDVNRLTRRPAWRGHWLDPAPRA